MSNYPEGVTGAEPAIVGGPESEFVDDRECGNCGVHIEVPVERWLSSGTVTETWTCPNPECDAPENSREYGLDEYMDDPDREIGD